MANKAVEDAWELLTDEPNMKRFNLFPAVMTTLYLGFIILYQSAITYVEVFGFSQDFFQEVIAFVHGGSFTFIIVVAVIGILLYVVTVPVAQAGLLALIDKNMRLAHGELTASEARNEHFYSYALSRGLMKFFPVFELNNAVVPFNLLSVLTGYIFALRFLGTEYIVGISIAVGCYLVLSLIANILFSYSRFFVVFEDKTPFEAIGASIEMTFDNLSETFELYFTVFLVYLRTFFTAVVFLVFPFLIFAAISYLSIGYVRTIGLVLLGLVFVFFVGLISHLNSVLEIFAQTVWYNTYRENQKEKARQGGE